MKRVFTLQILLLLLGSVFLGGCVQQEEPKKKVTVSSKAFTENILFGHIASLYLEEHGFEVDRKLTLQGTWPIIQGMKAGEIDIYYEYTGTLLMSVFKKDIMYDPDEVYRVVKKASKEEYNFELLHPLAYEHTYALSMREKDARELGIKTVSDLTEHDQDLTFGSDEEFLVRKDGYPRLQELYGLDFGEIKTMDTMLIFPAIEEGKVDVIMGLSMDARQYALNLSILEDDKGWQPPYYPVPVVRGEVVEKYPEIAGILNRLVPHLTRKKMLKLVTEVDIEGREESEVSKVFLIEEGLIEKR